MPDTRLSPDIIALIHQSELNRAGWFDARKKNAISTLFWLENKPLSENDVMKQQAAVGLTGLSPSETAKVLTDLCAEGVLIKLNDKNYRLSESEYANITSVIEIAETLEGEVISHFRELIEKEFFDLPQIDTDALWKAFHSEFLIPLVEFFGARTYEILTGNTTDIDQAPFALQFLNQFKPEQRPYVHRLIDAFLDPSQSDFRSYTLRLLNSHFFFIAHRYKREHLEALYGGDKRPTIRCLVDTNFLYSILELHENPSNEAAKALLDTINDARKYIDIRLYVFPPTIDELKRSLVLHEEYLSRIRVTRTITEAVSDGAVGGVALKFFKESAKSGYTLSAKDYFDWYQNDLALILHDKGIQIFNEKTDGYATDQRVIDDALNQLSFLTQRHRNRNMGGRPKSYEQIWHDILLWYFIFDKRPAAFESVLDAGFLGITIDYSLIGFDSFKRRTDIPKIPVFIHPATLIQLLQFFVPVDEKFESAIVDTLRLPFLFQEFDPETEKTTVRILARISRFENIDDLAPNTIRHLLQNEILRDKMERVESSAEEVTLIREALIEENARTQAELEEASRKKDELLNRVRNLEGLSAEDKENISELRSTIDQSNEAKESLEKQVGSLHDNLDKLTGEMEQREERNSFVSQFVKWPCIVILGVIAALLFSYDFSMSAFEIAIFSLAIGTAFMIWLYFMCWVGRSRAHVKNWTWFRKLNKLKLKLGGIATAFYVSLVVAVYWNVITEENSWFGGLFR